jgi:hypothetical protein
VPATQLVQLDEPGALVKVPAAQLLQLDAPAAE